MEPIVCYSCGQSLSALWEAFLALREIAVKKGATDLEEVFEALRIGRDRICCRARLATVVQFTDFQKGNFQPAGLR